MQAALDMKTVYIRCPNQQLDITYQHFQHLQQEWTGHLKIQLRSDPAAAVAVVAAVDAAAVSYPGHVVSDPSSPTHGIQDMDIAL